MFIGKAPTNHSEMLKSLSISDFWIQSCWRRSDLLPLLSAYCHNLLELEWPEVNWKWGIWREGMEVSWLTNGMDNPTTWENQQIDYEGLKEWTIPGHGKIRSEAEAETDGY
ncbi:unnamed protein product [Lactuca virosa]|uniref:Uncharacterized protein n=1 Tax=Lactuca virosa TaxID=75947 RepID=A0AAU9PFP2_9ASTR|nr:unnamed protein product [Lactuca virosa]